MKQSDLTGSDGIRPDGVPDTVAGRRVVVSMLVGSWNYGLETETSDRDHVAFVLPTFDDLYRSRVYHDQSITEGEDLTVHDIRRMPDLLWKSNPVFSEVLFSREVVVREGPSAPFVREVLSMRDDAVRMNLPAVWRSTMGVHSAKIARLQKGTSPLIDRFGYDTKQAMHAIRFLLFLQRFAASGFSDFGGAIRMGPGDREALLSVRAGS